jgi:sulfate adenylyltransferase
VFTLGQFAQAVERVPAGLHREALLAHVAETRGHADPALDVPDPYRRGPEAAEDAVRRLSRLVDTIVPRLRAQDV